ncbi:MAG TPA: C45 family peptidase [Actinomycetota bacterium]
MQEIAFDFRSIEELELGPKWQAVFEERWPHYRTWFLREGEEARPTYATGARMIREHMPELAPAYDRVVELAGGGDLAARMLSLYTPPPYLAACSQGVWTRDGGTQLVRNYDYSPSRMEGIVWSTRILRRVIGMSDCLWGLLDGMNEDGLAVSLTFGGRQVLGDGFGIPIVVRYLLETCTTVGDAREKLARLPYSLTHNLTLVDATGEVLTAYLSPDRDPIFHSLPAATNHQGVVEWPEQARATRTIERERRILELLEDPDV